MADVTDMRGYVELLEEMGELRRLDGVDLDLEVGALTERAADARLAEPTGEGLRFAHALIREALYEGTLPLRRRDEQLLDADRARISGTGRPSARSLTSSGRLCAGSASAASSRRRRRSRATRAGRSTSPPPRTCPRPTRTT